MLTGLNCLFIWFDLFGYIYVIVKWSTIQRVIGHVPEWMLEMKSTKAHVA